MGHGDRLDSMLTFSWPTCKFTHTVITEATTQPSPFLSPFLAADAKNGEGDPKDGF